MIISMVVIIILHGVSRDCYAEPCISYGPVVCPSVRPSVRLAYVTRWHCVKTTQATNENQEIFTVVSISICKSGLDRLDYRRDWITHTQRFQRNERSNALTPLFIISPVKEL